MEAVAGDDTLLAEEFDPRTGNFLGNTPLLFSQVMYVSAIMELSKREIKTRSSAD